MITAHHLVIDGISWRILLEDIYNLYQALIKNEPFKLPLKTGSLIDWQDNLIKHSESEELKSQVDYWNEIDNTEFNLPKKESSEHTNTVYYKCHFNFNKEVTGFLLKDANKPHGTDIEILLTTALVLTIRDFTNDNQILF